MIRAYITCCIHGIAFLQLKFATSSADVNLHFLTDYVATAGCLQVFITFYIFWISLYSIILCILLAFKHLIILLILSSFQIYILILFFVRITTLTLSDLSLDWVCHLSNIYLELTSYISFTKYYQHSDDLKTFQTSNFLNSEPWKFKPWTCKILDLCSIKIETLVFVD